MEVGYAREIPIAFKKIEVTETATAEIPASYGKSGKTAKAAGKASTTAASTAGKQLVRRLLCIRFFVQL